MRVRVLVYIAQNELIRGYAGVVYTLSSFRPHTLPFEDRKPTRLKVKVDIAQSSIANHCPC